MNEEDEIDPETERARNAAKALKELTESKGWSILKDIIQKQIKAITDDIMLKPRGDQKSEYGYEFSKGQAAGLRIALLLPESEYDTESAVANAGVKKNG